MAVALGGAVLCLIGYGSIVMIASAIVCPAIVCWRWKYGGIQIPDVEFTETQRMMKRELYLWLGVVAAEGLVLVVAEDLLY
jgi:hypothetical protein